MEKQSKVTQAKYLRTWEGHGKTFYIHGIAFENKDFGEYMSIYEQQNKFLVGQVADYEITGEVGKIKIKPIDAMAMGNRHGGFTDNQPKKQTPGNNRGFALSYAKDIICAKVTAMGSNYSLDEMELLQLAETFNNWLDNVKKEPFNPMEELDKISIKPSDDLPF